MYTKVCVHAYCTVCHRLYYTKDAMYIVLCSNFIHDMYTYLHLIHSDLKST